MSARKKDRRVTYTKTALRNALIELMRNQHISGITVKSICELADVNRSTFYLHYRDPYDLLHQMEQEVLETLGARLNTQQDTDEGSPMSLAALTEILEYAQENSQLAHVLLSENCDFALQRHITELVQADTTWMNPIHDERTKDYVISYNITGCIAIAEKWLRDGMIEQPDKIAQLMFQVIYYGTEGLAT
ncbi:MAG: TetR/AcrR family transcriptional regulator [Coriobacteriales bacterium]|jgi:AcrR family transcriptional regulator|nr:TetR/AcrR family transcriptional regulator [Coriobacteriales bacterium]